MELTQRLLYGKPRGSHSLLSFARDLKPLWRAAQQDDPYADWQLLRIQQQLESDHSTLSWQMQRYEKVLHYEPYIQLELATTDKPMRVNLNFSVPYAYMSAQLLGLFDYLLRHKRVGDYHFSKYCPPSVDRQLWKRRFRRSWAMPTCKQQWYPTGITRADVRQNTPLYQAAKAQWGEIPQNVLDRTLNLTHRPRIYKKP